MTDMELISVIVPVYNVESYLEKCIESILIQDYVNFELYLVDDGSTDRSGSLCDSYAQRDPRIRVLHKPNGGLSDARNAALDHIKGEYVVFIDSDDFVDPKYLSTLYRLIRMKHADISICNFQYISEKGILLNRVENSGEIIELSQKDALQSLVRGEVINTSASMKMYRTSLFKEIRYPKGQLYEDIATTYKLFFKADKLVYQNYAFYIYLCRTGSITKQSFTAKRLDAIKNTQEMCEAIKKIYPDLRDDCDARLYSQYVSTYAAALVGGANQAICMQLYQEMKTIPYNSYFKKKMKIYYRLSCLG